MKRSAIQVEKANVKKIEVLDDGVDSKTGMENGTCCTKAVKPIN